MNKIIHVPAGRPYDVHIASGLLGSVGLMAREVLSGAQKAAVITDSNVEALYLTPVQRSLEGAGFEIISLAIPPGEGSKNCDNYLSLLDELNAHSITRTDVIVALGGGVVGDLAGFAAATYLRGVRYVQVPTTLLAMVDSSVGGKTAIDLPAGKNLVGAFYQPMLVVCDPKTLDSLPPQFLSDGAAEVIKYGKLCAPGLLERLRAGADVARQLEVIAECITIKRDIVCEDEFDTGRRMLLNFGHTIGHAIEKLSGYEVSHGQAVAIGMAMDTRAALRKGLCPPECLSILEELLTLYHLPDKTEFSPQRLYEAALSDKKREGGRITIVTPRELGKCELITMPVTELLDWIETGVS